MPDCSDSISLVLPTMKLHCELSANPDGGLGAWKRTREMREEKRPYSRATPATLQQGSQAGEFQPHFDPQLGTIRVLGDLKLVMPDQRGYKTIEGVTKVSIGTRYTRLHSYLTSQFDCHPGSC